MSLRALELWLQRLLLRTDLTFDEQRALLALPGDTTILAANRDLVRPDHTTGECFLVVEGLLARYEQFSDGERQITALHLPGEMANLHAISLPTAAANFSPTAKSTIFRIPFAAIEEVVRAYPNLAQVFWRDCTVDATIMSQWVATHGRRSASGKLAQFLVEMAVRYFLIGRLHENAFSMPANQAQLGDILGMTAVHLNRMLRDFRERGLASWSSQHVTILNWKGLQWAASFDPNYLQIPRSTFEELSSRLAPWGG